MTRSSTSIRLAVLAAWLLAGPASHAGTLQDVLNRGNLRVGVAIAEPWAFRDDDGQWRGFEIDVARQLASDLRVSVDFIRYDFDELIGAIEAGEVDIVASGLSITAESLLHVNFSRPYAVGGIGIAANLAATADVARLEDLNDPRFTVTALSESVAAEIAERTLGRATLELVESEQEAAELLLTGDADIYLDEEPIPRFLALEHPDVVDVPINRPLLPASFAFAVNKGDPDFITYLDAWIVMHEDDTWLPTMHSYWFETLQWRD